MNKFNALLENTSGALKTAENDVYKIKDQLTVAEKAMEMHGRDLTRLHNIQQRSHWTGDRTAWQWNTTKCEANEYQKSAWSEYSVLSTTMLEFTVHLKERTDVKRAKWVLSVSARLETLPTASYRNDGYRDGDYGKNKYMLSHYDSNIMDRVWTVDPETKLELNMKFTSEEDARKAVQEWKDRLYYDHIGEIEYEQELAVEARTSIEV